MAPYCQHQPSGSSAQAQYLLLLQRPQEKALFLITLPWPLAPIGVPIVNWLPAYKWKDLLLNDVMAGITVTILLIPQGMAYAILAGVPPVYGLYSAIVPLLLYGCLGTSRHLSLGPMAITSLLLGVYAQKFGYEEQTDDYTLIVMKLSIVVGIVVFAMGLLQLGTLVNLISESVLVGFLTASAIVIFVNQMKYVFGIAVPRFDYTVQTIFYLLEHIGEANINACGVGMSSFAVLYAFRQWKRNNKPSPERMKTVPYRVMDTMAKSSNLICIVLGSLVAYALSANELTIDIVGHVPSGLKQPTAVLLTFEEFMGFIPGALAIAFVAFAGNWAVSKKYATDKGYEVSATQELIALGLSVLVGVSFNCFAGSGGLARSAVNTEAGAQTQISNMVAAVLILFAVLLLTPLFYYIPTAVLSAVIMVSVLSMVDFESMLKAYRMHHRKDCLVMVVTFLFTFFVGVSQGLVAGIFISVGQIVYAAAFPEIATLGRLPDNHHRGEGGHYKKVTRFPTAEQHPGVAIIRMDGTLFFANCAHFKDTALRAAAGEFHTSHEPIRQLIVDASCWMDIDRSAAQTLADLKKALDKMKITLALVNAKANVRDRLAECQFAPDNASTYYYFSIRDALEGVDYSDPTHTGELMPLRSSPPLAVVDLEPGTNNPIHGERQDQGTLAAQAGRGRAALASTFVAINKFTPFRSSSEDNGQGGAELRLGTHLPSREPDEDRQRSLDDVESGTDTGVELLATAGRRPRQHATVSTGSGFRLVATEDDDGGSPENATGNSEEMSPVK